MLKVLCDRLAMSSNILPVPFSDSDWERLERLAHREQMSVLQLVLQVVSVWILMQEDKGSSYQAERRRKRWLRGHMAPDVLDVLEGKEEDEK